MRKLPIGQWGLTGASAATVDQERWRKDGHDRKGLEDGHRAQLLTDAALESSRRETWVKLAEKEQR